jgi:hypothetical protein
VSRLTEDSADALRQTAKTRIQKLQSSVGRRKLAVVAMHADEVRIDAAVASDLIDAQFPHWRGLHARRVASSGTDNAIFRLGDQLAARFPPAGRRRCRHGCRAERARRTAPAAR